MTPVEQMTMKELNHYIWLNVESHNQPWNGPTSDLNNAMHCLELLAAEGREVSWQWELKSGWFQENTARRQTECWIFTWVRVPGDDPGVTRTPKHAERNPSLPLAIARCVVWALRKEKELQKESEVNDE